MKTIRIVSSLLAILTSCMLPGLAHATGEIFLVETTGLESCGDFLHARFGTRNNIDLYARIDSTTEISVSISPNFPNDGTTHVLTGLSYLKTSTSANFVGHKSLLEDGFVSIQGTAKADRLGNIGSLKGSFIQLGLFNSSCYSSGKFRAKRIN